MGFWRQHVSEDTTEKTHFVRRSRSLQYGTGRTCLVQLLIALRWPPRVASSTLWPQTSLNWITLGFQARETSRPISSAVFRKPLWCRAPLLLTHRRAARPPFRVPGRAVASRCKCAVGTARPCGGNSAFRTVIRCGEWDVKLSLLREGWVVLKKGFGVAAGAPLFQ